MNVSQLKSSRSIRRSLAAALALAAALSLAACSGATGTSASGSASSGPKALRIGFSPFTLQVPALKGLADGLTGMASAQGDKVVTADPKNDPSTQLQQIKQWVELGQIDALWVIPVAATTLTPVIKEAQSKGIVVIASGTPADYKLTAGAKGITFTNVDNAAFGTKLGDLTAKCITDNLGGKGEVIFLQSPSGQQSSSLINDAFHAAVKAGAPNATFVSELVAKDRLGSTQEILSAIQGNPTANTVVGTDDESTLGGLDAFGQASKSASSTCVVGAGGNDEAKADVKSGKIYGEVAFDFAADLAQNLGELHTMAAAPSAAGKTLTTPIQVITK